METTEQILERQYTRIQFRNGAVEYFSISTQHDKANTVEEAINNILEADKKYNGKAPLTHRIEYDSAEIKRWLESILNKDSEDLFKRGDI